MALQKDYVFRGLPVPNAYHKINAFRISKPSEYVIEEDGVDAEGNPKYKKTLVIKNVLEFDIGISTAKGISPFDFSPTQIINYDLASADNAYKQVYNYLKTLPEYAGATDV